MAGTRPPRNRQGSNNQGKGGKTTGSGQRARQARNRGAAQAVPGTSRSAQDAARGSGNGARPVPGAADGTAAADLAPRSGPADRTTGGPPGWLRLTTFILSLGGLGVSIYLTISHYSTAVTLACPESSTINCEKVTTSPQSIVFGIPVAVLGLAFYVFMAVINSPLGWRAPLRAVPLTRVLSVIVGIGFALYLVYVELFKVNAICLWCTSVHVITFVLFVLIVFGAAGLGTSSRTR
jgi:uncharacterized membrane protein